MEASLSRVGIAEMPSYLEDAKKKGSTPETGKADKPSFLDEMKKKAAARENAPPAKLSFLEELAKKPKKVVQLVEPVTAVSSESLVTKSAVKKDESAHKSKRVGFASDSNPSTVRTFNS